MFDETKKNELISKITKLPELNNSYKIYTQAQHRLNLINKGELRDFKRLLVATKHSDNFKKAAEVPWWMIEKVYNELESKRNHPISQNEISKLLRIKRSALVISVLSLLTEEIEYLRPINSLKLK